MQGRTGLSVTVKAAFKGKERKYTKAAVRLSGIKGIYYDVGTSDKDSDYGIKASCAEYGSRGKSK